jgi:hypothetical protein
MKISKRRLKEIIKEELNEIWNPFQKKEKAPEKTLVQHGEGWRWPGHPQAGRTAVTVPPKTVQDITRLLAVSPPAWRVGLIVYMVNRHQGKLGLADRRRINELYIRPGGLREDKVWRGILATLFNPQDQEPGTARPSFFIEEFITHLNDISRLPLYRGGDKTQETAETVWSDYRKTLEPTGAVSGGIEWR